MDIQQIIKDRYKELPQDIQEAIKSNDLAGKFNAIANKHNLHIDQNGALQTETLLVMLGLEPTVDYVNNIERNLNISRTEALSIVADVNTEILGVIKNSLRTMEDSQEPESTKSVPPVNTPITLTTPVQNFAHLEKAGQFTIEKAAPASNSSQYKEENINKEALLKSIEDKPEPTIVPMIDHLLTAHVNTPEKIEVRETPPTRPIEQKKSYSADPYREQL